MFSDELIPHEAEVEKIRVEPGENRSIYTLISFYKPNLVFTPSDPSLLLVYLALSSVLIFLGNLYMSISRDESGIPSISLISQLD